MAVFVEDMVINLNIIHSCLDAVIDCICYKQFEVTNLIMIQ